MQGFEQQFYESEQVWKEGLREDEYNLKRLNTSIELIPKGTATLADIGCGDGIFGMLLQKQRPEIDSLSVDRSETALKRVKTKKKVGDISALPFEDKTFDCVTCFEVLEHIPYPVYDTVLGELSRIAKKNVIISVPFQEKTENNITKCPACHATFNTVLHVRNFFDKDIQQLFSKFGYKCVHQQLVEKKNTSYLGVNWYIRFRNARLKNKGKFLSPICIVCGYENPAFKTQAANQGQATAQQDGGGIKSMLKKLWPTVKTKVYWVIGVYERV